jgi:hypothetical protein
MSIWNVNYRVQTLAPKNTISMVFYRIFMNLQSCIEAGLHYSIPNLICMCQAAPCLVHLIWPSNIIEIDAFAASVTEKTFMLYKVKCPCASFNWAPRHQDVLGEWRYSYTHSLTSALDGGEWAASRPGRFTPRERAPHTHWISGWVHALHFFWYLSDTTLIGILNFRNGMNISRCDASKTGT